MTVLRHQLVAALQAELQPQLFNDYCPNGLQVEGAEHVGHIVTGVTASQALIEAAVAAGADTILVHHGYFWKGDDPCLVGMLGRRVAALMRANINLLAYHLPLDAHPRLGNNVQLAQRLGLRPGAGLGDAEPAIGLVAELEQPCSGAELAALIAAKLGRQPLHIATDRPIRTVALCTGAAQGMIAQAAAQRVDAFITGEASEQTTHSARELGLHFYAAGHHATERYGVQAVGEWLAQTLGVRHTFIDIANPV